MSRTEKIQEIDRELRETLALCTASGLSQAEIKSSAEPVLAIRRQWKRRERLWTIICISLLVALGATLYQNKVTYKFISAVTKITFVKLLPYWDWTAIYNRECLFYNPYEEKDELTEEDCKPLANLTDVSRKVQISQESMADDHLFSGIPVIVTDAMTDWRAVKDVNFDFNYLRELYKEDPILSNTTACGFSRDEETLLQFLDNVDNLKDFQAHWGHCKLSAAKAFRHFYKRPYFMPGMVEANVNNYVAIGKTTEDQQLENYKNMYLFENQMTWCGQVKGQFKFRLLPHEICRKTCSTLEGTLQPGEILVYCNEKWLMQYQVTGEDEAVAIMGGGIWYS